MTPPIPGNAAPDRAPLAWLLVAPALVLLAACAAEPSRVDDVSDRQVRQTLRDNDCFKCHSVNREKKGPAWQEVATKYRDKGDAEERLYRHLTTAPIIDLDGDPESHKVVKAMGPEEVRSLARWILSL